MALLGVNVDHIATLRQTRLEFDPDPVSASRICELAGADSIVAHLREDRRHIQDKDIIRLKEVCRKRFNIEMSLNDSIIKLALRVKPHQVTIVPEKRQELTTEGGLDVVKNFSRVVKASRLFSKNNIEVSLFIDPAKRQIQKTKDAGIKIIEIHTGHYARLYTQKKHTDELSRIAEMTQYARSLGLIVNAGHGLKYDNVKLIAQIPYMNELNIGHSIIARAMFVGLKQAVHQMKKLVS